MTTEAAHLFLMSFFGKRGSVDPPPAQQGKGGYSTRLIDQATATFRDAKRVITNTWTPSSPPTLSKPRRLQRPPKRDPWHPLQRDSGQSWKPCPGQIVPICGKALRFLADIGRPTANWAPSVLGSVGQRRPPCPRFPILFPALRGWLLLGRRRPPELRLRPGACRAQR